MFMYIHTHLIYKFKYLYHKSYLFARTVAPHGTALPHVKTAPAIACRAGQWKVADGTVAKPVGGAKGGRAGLGFPEGGAPSVK